MFENATLLTSDWLDSNITGNAPKWTAAFFSIKTKEYYNKICNYIKTNFYLRPTTAQIEEYIANGTYTHTDTLDNETVVTCKITAADERIYWFKMAQAYQLVYDCDNGLSDMCEDTKNCLLNLGIYQRTATTI